MSVIIVPTDFSPNANAALRYAIMLSRLIKNDLLIFHCSHISAYALSAAKTETEMNLLLKEDEGHKMEMLAEQVKEAYKELDINEVPSSTTCLVEYQPMVVERTIELAKEKNASLIVMGTHGATGVKKFFFGSNTSVMISRSDIPVLAIPENYKFVSLSNIIFASDLERLNTELQQLIPFAQSANANINVLYLNYGIDEGNNLVKNAEDLIKNMDYKKIILVNQKANIETSLVNQIKKYIATTSPDCLVMFTRERSLWDRLFLRGSKTEDMSSALSIPLLSFKKK